MRADRPGVGMRRNDRLFGNFRHVIKQSVAGMRHVRHDGEPLHLFQCFPSKGGKPQSRVRAAAQLVFPIPGQRHHFTPRSASFSRLASFPPIPRRLLLSEPEKRFPTGTAPIPAGTSHSSRQTKSSPLSRAVRRDPYGEALAPPVKPLSPFQVQVKAVFPQRLVLRISPV